MRRRGYFIVALVIVCATSIVMPLAGASDPPRPTDTSPPVGTVLYPLPGAWAPGPDTWLRVRFSDSDGVDFYSLSISIDGAPLGVIWADAAVLMGYANRIGEGPHVAEARASDNLGNGPTVVTWSFSLDATPPQVAITSPSRNPELTDGSVTLAWTGSDVGSGIQRYEVRLDDGPPIDVGTATSLPFPSLPPGIHYFHVFAYDIVGNSNVSSALATVPAASPNSTTLVTVVMPDGIPPWAIVLVVINAVEAAAIAWVAFGRRRPPPGAPGP